VSIEDAFWIAHERDETLSNLIAKIDADRQHANLSSAVRLFVLDWARDRASAQAPKQHQELAVA
jgi:predicted DNA-binding ribbon-helix-helix protein